jgi:hypothetical protein
MMSLKIAALAILPAVASAQQPVGSARLPEDVEANTTRYSVHTVSGVPVQNGYDTYGALENFTNLGPKDGYGRRTDCFSHAASPGFDICSGVIHVVRTAQASGGATQYLASWEVELSPDDSSTQWGSFISEINPVNRGDDLGWGAMRGQFARWTGGIQHVPESQTFGEPGTGHNVLFGFLTAHSGSRNTLGEYVKTYNAFIAEQDSIAPDGRAFFAGGATSHVVADEPYGPFEARDRWRHGIDLTGAIFDDGMALRMAPGQVAGYESGSSIAGLGSTGNGASLAPALVAGGSVQVVVSPTAAANRPIVLSGGQNGVSGASVTARDADLDLAGKNCVNLKAGDTSVLQSCGAGVVLHAPIQIQMHTPSSSREPCAVGTTTFDASYQYDCVAKNTWRRMVLSAF